MYGFPDMIDSPKVKWQSPEHRQVAINIAICNPNVTTMSLLNEICESVNKIPQNRIQLITPNQCVEEFNVPQVW